MSRNYVALNVPNDDLNMGNKYTDMRMAMYRSRGGFSMTKRGNLEIRTFAADHFKKYMAQLDKEFDLNNYLADPTFKTMGFSKPEDLIYIDGKPAFEFARGLGYSEKELKEYPEILQAEIAAAMTGGRNHVDVAVPSINKNREYEIKAHELRADVRDLNGKEGWASSSREKRMESLYQSKNRDSRLNEINKAMSPKLKKTNAIRFLSEQILYNAGLEEEFIHDPNEFKLEKDYALKEATNIIAEAEQGEPARKSKINTEYTKKRMNEYTVCLNDADEISRQKLGTGDTNAHTSAWKTVGEENAESNTIARLDSRGISAIAFAIHKNPSLKAEDMIQNKNLYGQALTDYYQHLKNNPTQGNDVTDEQRVERYQQQANHFKNFRKMQMDLFPKFDFTDKDERLKHIGQIKILRDMSINCLQIEDTLSKKEEYTNAYGGQDKLNADRDRMFLLAPMINAIAAVDNPTMKADQKAGALYFINKFGPFYKRINEDNIHEIAKLPILNGLVELQMGYEGIFDALKDQGKITEKALEKYVNGGPVPINEKEMLSEVKDSTAFGGNLSPKDLLAAVDKIDAKIMKDKKDSGRKKSSMADLIDKQDGKAPERKRANAVKSKNLTAAQQLKQDPLKKK